MKFKIGYDGSRQGDLLIHFIYYDSICQFEKKKLKKDIINK